MENLESGLYKNHFLSNLIVCYISYFLIHPLLMEQGEEGMVLRENAVFKSGIGPLLRPQKAME